MSRYLFGSPRGKFSTLSIFSPRGSTPRPSAPPAGEVELGDAGPEDWPSGLNEEAINWNHISYQVDDMEWVKVLKALSVGIKVFLVTKWYGVSKDKVHFYVNEQFDGLWCERWIPGFKYEEGRTKVSFSSIVRVIPCVSRDYHGLNFNVPDNQKYLPGEVYTRSFFLQVAHGQNHARSLIMLSAASIESCFGICKVLSICQRYPDILTEHRPGINRFISLKSLHALKRDIIKTSEQQNTWYKLSTFVRQLWIVPYRYLRWIVDAAPLLPVGLVVRVKYHNELVIRATSRDGKRGRIHLPLTTQAGVVKFGSNMYCVAKIVESKQQGTKCYTLRYLHGPYQKNQVFGFRKQPEIKLFRPETEFIDVSSKHIKADQSERASNHQPYFICTWSLIQVYMFFAYCLARSTTPNYSSPIGGKPFLWFKMVGDGDSGRESNDDFPVCDDLRGDLWRFWSYQFVHVGYSHVLFNVCLQLLLGIPLEMVHGSFRICLLYQIGVICGSLCSAVGDVYTNVVGSSGGGYCIIGVHVANLIINWTELRGSLYNRWGILLFLTVLFLIEYIETESNRSEETSYAAHYGGFASGLLLGIIVLYSPIWKRYKRCVVVPLAMLLFVTAVTGSIYWIAAHDTPTYLFHLETRTFENKPCCWQVMECEGLAGYDQFQCKTTDSDSDHVLSEVKAGNVLMRSCSQMLNYTNGNM